MRPAQTILDHRRRRRNTRDHWYTLELGAGVDFSRLTVVSAHGGDDAPGCVRLAWRHDAV